VPLHLRNASFRGADSMGYGRNYKYPHDFPGHWTQQQYLPDGILAEFYKDSEEGRERQLGLDLAKRRGQSRD
jgi:putative ATPase